MMMMMDDPEPSQQNGEEEEEDICANCCQMLTTNPLEVVECKLEEENDEDDSDNDNHTTQLNYSESQQTGRMEDQKFFLELQLNNKIPTSPSSSPLSTDPVSNNNVKVIDALSSLYKLDDYATIFNINQSQKSHDENNDGEHQEISSQRSKPRVGLCRNCAVMLTELYKIYEEFNKARHQESYLHREILKLKQVIDQCAAIVKDGQLETVVPSSSKKRKSKGPTSTKKSTSKKKKKNQGKKLKAKKSNKQQQPKPEFNWSDGEGTNDEMHSPSNTNDDMDHCSDSGSDYPTNFDNDVPRSPKNLRKRPKPKAKDSGKKPTKMTIISDDEDGDNDDGRQDIKADNHNGENQVTKCPHCGKDLKNVTALNNHMQSAHPPPFSFLCSDCGLRFSTKRNLKLHTSRRHQLVKRHPCDQCDKGYFSKRELELHVANHHRTEKSFKCDQCDKCFASAVVLKQHLRRHDVAQRSFLCSECGSSFFLRSDLERHCLLVHQDERKFPCSVCSRAFKLDHHRKRHEETHLGKCKVCPICNATFTARMIKKHVKSHSKPPTEGGEAAAAPGSGPKVAKSKASSSSLVPGHYSPGMMLSNYVSEQLGLDQGSPFHNLTGVIGPDGTAAATTTTTTNTATRY